MKNGESLSGMAAAAVAFRQSLKMLFSDSKLFYKGVLPPIVLGLFFYLLLTWWFFRGFLPQFNHWVLSKISGLFGINSSLFFSADGGFFYWMLSLLLVFAFAFFINLTYLLVVSIFASPFNDYISKRAEFLIGKTRATTGDSTDDGWGFRTFGNLMKREIKKISLILFVSILTVLLNLLPILFPLSFLLTGILISWQFSDYAWSRHELELPVIITEIRKNLLLYCLSGWLFLILLSIPLLNVLVIPFAVIYYSIVVKRI
ncbi:MAG: EI24 domain-containing protein [Oligoflexia bacterium]|nr:EI24 domain-containing protein [Oligoflexia bacterium]